MYNLKFFRYALFPLLLIFNILMLYKLASYMKSIKFFFLFLEIGLFYGPSLSSSHQKHGYNTEIGIEELI